MIRQEIGSEYWGTFEEAEERKTSFPNEVQFYLSGRTALFAILSEITQNRLCSRAYLPDYCCWSVVEPFQRLGMDVSFYPVSIHNGMRADIDPAHSCDVVLTMDYFGYRGLSVELPQAIHIHDRTHSLLSEPTFSEADYIFGSLRKWGPVAAAGFARARTGELKAPAGGDEHPFALLRKRSFALKDAYMKGESGDKQEYLDCFEQAEGLLDRNYAGYGAESTSLVNACRIADGKEKRRQNAMYLSEGLKDSKLTVLICGRPRQHDVPLYVPVLVKHGLRNALRAYLIQHEVYCPVHWPAHNGIQNELYENELSLICDQRYGFDGMERQIGLIKEFEKKAGL